MDELVCRLSNLFANKLIFKSSERKIRMRQYMDMVSELADCYLNRYIQFAFRSDMQEDMDEKQYEALIIKFQHGIEKGLSAFPYRQGAGKDYFFCLASVMKNYSEKYDTSHCFYETAFSTLVEFIEKNKSEGIDTMELEGILKNLPGKSNGCGGYLTLKPKERKVYAEANFKELMEGRHSVRHFSSQPVILEDIKAALRIAQLTPSACNRQGWKSRIIVNKEIKSSILKNQNGNKGFEDEIDKLLVITFDLRFSNIEREVHQAFIDGGMYAMSVLCALYYMGIASVPLSASLHISQEKNVRNLIGMEDAEVLILFIGVGNYVDEYKITKSNRKEAFIEVI